MTGAVAFAFALGVLAPLAPAGIPWALVALGLRVSSPGAGDVGIGASVRDGVAVGALAGLVFASVLLVAAGAEEIGLNVSDGLPLLNLLLSAALVALGLGVALRARRFAPAPKARDAALFALAYAVVSMPGVVDILHRLLERSSEQGVGGIIGGAILVLAGAATAFAAISLAGILIGRAAGNLRQAVGAVAVIAGGAISLIYWLPDARGGATDPGSGIGDALAEASRSIGDLLAGNLLIPALFFLALGVWGLVGATRAERA